MKKEELEIYLLIGVLFLAVFLFLKPNITGYVVYSPNYYNWTFDSSGNYIFDSSLIDISDGSAKLKLQEEEYSWTTFNSSEVHVVAAEYNGEDKTIKVNTVDSDNQKVKNHILNVIFDDQVENGILIMHLIGWDHSNVFVCEYNVSCEEGYGSVSFHNSGWYNITLSNLNSDRLGITTDDEVRVDYLEISKEWEEENTAINLTYPESAGLETETFSLPNVNRIGLFSKNEELNGQEIKYYYYDSEWIEIPENGSLPELSEIKLKAEFNSDSVSTPILYNMVLNYEYCEENWECSDFSSCYENGTKIRNCVDLNECGTVESKPNDTEICTYFPGYYEVNKTNIISLEKNNLTRLNTSDVLIDIIVNESIVGSSLEIKEVENLTELSGKVKVRGIDVSLASVNNYLEEGLIKMYYDKNYLSENNIDENSLKINYFNNGTWEELDSIINKEESYVYAYVNHFSVYGLFGEQITGSSGSSGSSSGSGGKSTFVRGDSVEEPEEVVEEIVEEPTEDVPIVEEIVEEPINSNNFESFTGLVVYNAKQAKVSVPIGIGLVAIMLVFFVRLGNFNRKIKV